MASILLTSTIFCSRPTKLFLGAGKLCLPTPIGSSWEEPTDGVIGRLPAAISSRRRRLEAAGRVPGPLESTSRSRSYWARARSGRPEMA
jgi:hypothetical protein